jgi:hypothetical protein
MNKLSKNAEMQQSCETAVMQSAILPHNLRIGNLTYNSKKELYIVGWINCNVENKLFPVEITEKWLEKMGFIRDDDTSYRWFILDRSVAYDLDDNCIRISDSWEFGKRKYVHELQNLIFFLSGVELAVA